MRMETASATLFSIIALFAIVAIEAAKAEDKAQASTISLRPIVVNEPATAKHEHPLATMRTLPKPEVVSDSDPRILVARCANGDEAVLHQHDLVRPSLELLDLKHESDGSYSYKYKVSNAADALESINRVFFSPGNAYLEEVKPGQSVEFVIWSTNPPGPVQATVQNFDLVKESRYIESHHPRKPMLASLLTDDPAQHCGSAMSGMGRPLIEISVMGPTHVPPAQRRPELYK